MIDLGDYAPITFSTIMTSERQTRQLVQRLHQLDYELHSCQQTLRLVQMSHASSETSSDLVRGQEQLYQQLQRQQQDVVRKLSSLT